MFNKLFAKNLRMIRKRRGYTQKFIADKIGITRPTYTYYESARAQPTLENLVKLANILEVTTDELLQICSEI